MRTTKEIFAKLAVLLCVMMIGAMLVSCSSTTTSDASTPTTTQQTGSDSATQVSDATASGSDLQLVTTQDTDIGEMI